MKKYDKCLAMYSPLLEFPSNVEVALSDAEKSS